MNHVELKVENFLHGNRLSTYNAIGTSILQSDLRAFFREICPHRVSISRPYEFSLDMRIKRWCKENCTGYWTDTTLLRSEPFDRSWFFQNEIDAVMFKLAI